MQLFGPGHFRPGTASLISILARGRWRSAAQRNKYWVTAGSNSSRTSCQRLRPRLDLQALDQVYAERGDDRRADRPRFQGKRGLRRTIPASAADGR